MSNTTSATSKGKDKYIPSERIITLEDLAEIILSESITNKCLNIHPPRLSLFLGAGASRSSKIKLGGQMVKHFVETIFARERKYKKENKDSEAIEKKENELINLKNETNEKKQQEWDIYEEKKRFLKNLLRHNETESEYSFFFRNCYRKEIDRRDYIRSIIEPAEISWGYIQLANLIERGVFRNILTTNFDDLVYQACTSFTKIRPILFSYGNFASEVTFSSNRPQIFKLHGDFLYSKLKNTDDEINSDETSDEEEDPNMRRAFEQSLQNHQGIVVIGYAGADKSIIDLFKKIPKTHYLLWCVVWNKKYDNQPLTWDWLEKNHGKKLAELLKTRDGFIVKTNGFDEVMSKLCESADIGYDDIICSVIKRTTSLRNTLYNFKREPVKFLSRTETEEKERLKLFKQEINKVYLATSYFFLGYDSYLKNIYDKAEEYYEKSINIYDKFADVYLNYANLLAKDGEKQLEAEMNYRKAIKLSPLDAYVYNRLGSLLTFHPSQKDEAKILIERAIELKPDFEFAFYNLGIWYRQWQDFEKAKDNFEMALKISVEFVNPLISLIAIHIILGNQKELPELKEKILKLLQKDDLYNQACFYAVIENKDLAIRYLIEAIKKDPKIRYAAKNDLNFEFISHDPEFMKIIIE